MKDILLIPNIKIHNANALSSPYTVGFPAMTAWLGFMHALERKLSHSDIPTITFTGLIVSCLDITLQTYKGYSDYVSSLIVTSNPLLKNEKRPAFIEEARCDLEVTIAIECQINTVIDYAVVVRTINKMLPTFKIASGDTTFSKSCRFLEVENSKPQTLTRYLMPGFCLVSRNELMQEAMNNGQDCIDAILDYVKLTSHIEIDENKKITKSKFQRKEEKGWLVPISVGYQGISELKLTKNQRDSKTPHRFAESVVTLGEFKMPYHFDTIEEMIWRYQPYKDNDLYLCENNFINNNQESKL